MFYDSRRSTVLARNGMVATSQPLAALAGLRQMMQGGNAVDAAVAAAAVLNVVEPVSTGVGGDMFALVWNNKEKSLRAINGSGRAPGAASLEELRAKGHSRIPEFGVRPPARTLTTVRMVAPAPGSAPNAPAIILARPWPTRSRSDS